jgi:D-alanyl-D-alanine carboxypeptidase
MRRRANVVGVVGVVLVSLVAAACGSDGTSSTTASVSTIVGTPSPTTASPDVSPELLKPVPWPGKAPNLTPVDAATAAAWRAQAKTALKAQEGLNGLWVAISDPHKGYWAAAIGNAVKDPATPATIDDHARIGSAGKTFTATAILEQVAAQKLTLDDTVATVIPDTAAQFPATAQVTVRQLLSMSSGLPDYVNPPGTVATDVIKNPGKVWTPEELIANALQHPVSPPGTPGYCNTNYQLLGLMLEKITGKPVDQVVTDVAHQAGLVNTALPPPDQIALPPPPSHGYVDAAFLQDPAVAGTGLTPGTDVTDWTMSWAGAAGGMYSTVQDLFTWAATGMGTALLPPNLAADRLNTNVPALPGKGYGLGIQQIAVPGWIGHGGQSFGWTSFSVYNPQTGATITGLANSPTGVAAVATLWQNILLS